MQMKETGKFEKSMFGSWLDERPIEEENERARERETEKPKEKEGGKDNDKEKEKPKTSGDLRDLLDMKSPGALKKALADYLARNPPKVPNERRRSRSPPQKPGNKWKQDRRRSPERRPSPDRRRSPQRRQSNDRDQRGRSPNKGYNKYKWVNQKNGWQNRKRQYGKDRSPEEKRGRK